MAPKKAKGTRRAFSDEFKEKAAKRVVEGGETQAAVAESLGVHASVVSNWVASARRKADYQARAVKRIANRKAKAAGAAPLAAAPGKAPSVFVGEGGRGAPSFEAIAVELAALEARKAVLKKQLLELLAGSP